jgi:inosine-uridine nucleoside N-ribohydrolase
MARSIIIDTDPSPDDAVAFLMALGSPDELDLLAITTVGGNAPLALTTKNALKALELTGRGETPVFAGASGPLCRVLETAEYVHGENGFEGYDLPVPMLKPATGFAADAIVDLVMARPERTVTMCCLAPLTNLALALAREPRLARRLERIVLMGGAFSEGGNVSPCADRHDPARLHASGADDQGAAETSARRRQAAYGGVLPSVDRQQAFRREQIRDRRRAAARPDRSRLYSAPRAVWRA